VLVAINYREYMILFLASGVYQLTKLIEDNPAMMKRAIAFEIIVQIGTFSTIKLTL
jgi:hypothetical protein